MIGLFFIGMVVSVITLSILIYVRKYD